MADEEKELEIVEETQDFSGGEKKEDVPYKQGDIVYHSSYYIRNVLRGNARDKARQAEYEVISCTPRSVTVRPKGSTHPYGSQYPHKYIDKTRPA